jgi:ketosteroid isomerase-like protein
MRGRMRGTVLEVLEANEAFYRAFAARDPEAMTAIWSSAHPVACIHPGWDVLDGRDAVLGSWRRILTSGDSPDITCSLAEARVFGDVAFVTCHEAIGAGRLAATNVFVREGGAWRMVHHQATPIAPGQERPSGNGGPAN